MDRAMAYPSIAAIGANVAAVAAGHMELAFRHILRGPNVVADRQFLRLMTGESHPFANFAIFSDPAELEAAAAAIEPLVRCAAPAAALFTGQVSGPLQDRLMKIGFEPHGVMPAMAIDAAGAGSTSLPAGYSFSRVGSGAEGDEWARAFATGYEIPPGVGEAFSPNVVCATPAADAPVQYFAVRKGGRMVCTSLMYLADGVAGIYCVATSPEERSRGLGAHATAEPLRLARQLGYGVGVLQSSPAGHSVYCRLGFIDVGGLHLYVKNASST